MSLIHRIDAHVLLAVSSCSSKDLGHLNTCGDDTWYTLNSSPIDNGELEQTGDIKLALPDLLSLSDVDTSARPIVIYKTRWRKNADEEWRSEVRWKGTFITKKEAYEGYWW